MFCFLIVTSVFFNSCKDDKLENLLVDNKINLINNVTNNLKVSYKTGLYIIFYESKTLKNTTESTVSINKATDGIVVFKSEYTINTEFPAYRLASHQGVINEAEKVKKSYSNEIKNIKLIFEDFGKSLVNDTRLDFTSQNIQSVFYHNSIINTAYRSTVKETDCGCTPHPDYILDEKGFWCQEDYMIDPAKLLASIKNSNYKIRDGEINAFEYLNNNNNHSKISIDKISNLIEPKEKYLDRISKAYLAKTNELLLQKHVNVAESCTQGSDLGCCGNYSGCCLYWSLVCLEHDLACIDCDHWYCGWQCTPTPHSKTIQ